MTALDEKALEKAARAIAIRHGTDPDKEGPGRRHAVEIDGVTTILSDHHGPLWKMWTPDASAAISAYLTALPQSPVGELESLVEELTTNANVKEGSSGWKPAIKAMRLAATALLSLQAENERLRGAMRAQDEREKQAGERCGVPYEEHGCDWPDAVADELICRAESKAERFVMVPVVVWDAQTEAIRLYATQLRQDGYETPDGRNLLANRPDVVAEHLSSAAAPSDKLVKVESMGKAK